ncbi:hypothetical protein NDA18_002391 [Ustilago nuda]|nr:hypothetical protein NDA18_002391 [Ustilago nuda]
MEEAGKGEGKGGLEDKMVTWIKVGKPRDGLKDMVKEGEGDRKLEACAMNSMQALISAEGTFEVAAAETGDVEAKIHVVGPQGTQFVFGGVEGMAGSGEVGKPFQELGAACWEAGGAKAELAHVESVKGGRAATCSLASAGGEPVPEQGGGSWRGGEAWWWVVVVGVHAEWKDSWLLENSAPPRKFGPSFTANPALDGSSMPGGVIEPAEESFAAWEDLRDELQETGNLLHVEQVRGMALEEGVALAQDLGSALIGDADGLGDRVDLNTQYLKLGGIAKRLLWRKAESEGHHCEGEDVHGPEGIGSVRSGHSAESVVELVAHRPVWRQAGCNYPVKELCN